MRLQNELGFEKGSRSKHNRSSKQIWSAINRYPCLGTAAGITFNYPQLTKLASVKSESSKNPTIETLEKVVEIFRSTIAPDLEMWMLLKEGYFGNKQTTDILDAKIMDNYLNEFLFALTTMKVVSFSKEQYETALNVGKFCYLKLVGTPSTDQSVKVNLNG